MNILLAASALTYILPAAIAAVVAIAIAWYNNYRQKKNTIEIEIKKSELASNTKKQETLIETRQNLSALFQKVKAEIDHVKFNYEQGNSLALQIESIADARMRLQENYGKYIHSFELQESRLIHVSTTLLTHLYFMLLTLEKDKSFMEMSHQRILELLTMTRNELSEFQQALKG